MQIRQSILASPLRVVGAAVIVILLFALAYPFVGTISETNHQTETTFTYTLETSDLSQPRYAFTVLAKSLHLSVQTFTLAGSNQFTPVLDAAYLADLESLLGMGFLGLFTASLVRGE